MYFITSREIYRTGAYLHAFSSIESNAPPGKPLVSGTDYCIVGKKNLYNFTSIDPDNNPVSFYVDLGDGTITESIEFASGENGWVEHNYNKRGIYTIKAKARDVLGEESDWSDPFIVEIYNAPPEKPYNLYGESHGRVGVDYTYYVTSSDPNGHRIYYLFDWGDGTNSSWVGPYFSGREASAINNWTSEGTYEIKVKAKDIFGLESEWSDPLVVTMPRYKTTSLLYWLLEEHPRLFSLFHYLMRP